MNAPVTENKPRDISPQFNRFAYGLAVLTGLYFMIFSNFNDGVAMLGLALVFDPFNQKQPFDQRPMYQRVWLIVHALSTLGLFIYMIAR